MDPEQGEINVYVVIKVPE